MLNTSTNKTKSRSVNLIRISVLLLVLPVLYMALWIPISGDETLTYFEKVAKLMGYFPQQLRHPFGIALAFLGMSAGAGILSFYAYMKSETARTQWLSIIICLAAVFLAILFGVNVFR